MGGGYADFYFMSWHPNFVGRIARSTNVPEPVMNPLKFLILAVVLLAVLPAGAQSLSVSPDAPVAWTAESTSTTTSFNNPDDAFFLDRNERVCFVDFSTLSLNVQSIQVSNLQGDVVIQDQNVSHLPVYSIYEIDLTQVPNGRYQVTLQGYTGSISKEIRL